MSFSTIGLSNVTMQGVCASGFVTPTEIQRKAIPAALNGHDIIACAPTGTGKTAAFVLPTLDRLQTVVNQNGRNHTPRALILTPTRELAVQIESAIKQYGKFTWIQSVAVFGGVNIEPQIQKIRKGTDIVVATPGRLLDLINRGNISLTDVGILILDEADRMYDMGFIRDVRTIIGRVPKKRQTLLFSATMSSDIRALVAEIQKNPISVDIGEPCMPVDTVQQHFYAVSKTTKTDLLIHLLQNTSVETALVFSRTKHGADKINKLLVKNGINSTAIHSNRSQAQRQRALEGFKRRDFDVLVATDIAARGIDVIGISHVINYDTPTFAEDYVHRIGRTGRAQLHGMAFTLVSPDEIKFVRRIELLTGKRFRVAEYPGFQSMENKPALSFGHKELTPHRSRYGQTASLQKRAVTPNKYIYNLDAPSGVAH